MTKFHALPAPSNWLGSDVLRAGRPRAEKKSKDTVMTPEVTKLMKYSVEVTINRPRQQVVGLFENPELMPKWQRALKRLIDVLASVLVLVLLSPLLLYIAIRVRLSSPSPEARTRDSRWGRG